MDYDWNYFIDDLKNGKIDIDLTSINKNIVCDMMERASERKIQQMKNLVKEMFCNYRIQGTDYRYLIEKLMNAHTEYCKTRLEDEQLKRRHNALVYRYMMKTALHNKAVAIKLSVSVATVQNDISQAVEEIMILCFGMMAEESKPKNLQEAIKCFICRYQLLELSQQIQIELPWKEWQQLRIEYLEQTDHLLSGIKKVIQIYEMFISSSTFPDMQERGLEAIKNVYLYGSSNISEMAAVYHVSEGTIYTDVNKMLERLAELVVVIVEMNI